MSKINLGYVAMASYRKNTRLFPSYWGEDNDDYGKKQRKEVEETQPNDVVLQPGKYSLKITYPLSNPFEIVLNVGKGGMTRRELVNRIVESYKAIYKAEENPGNIPGMLNRSTSEGPYGIWGHHLEDLMLHTAYVSPENVITVSCDS
jgi:hypothetical protein